MPDMRPPHATTVNSDQFCGIIVIVDVHDKCTQLDVCKKN